MLTWFQGWGELPPTSNACGHGVPSTLPMRPIYTSYTLQDQMACWNAQTTAGLYSQLLCVLHKVGPHTEPKPFLHGACQVRDKGTDNRASTSAFARRVAIASHLHEERGTLPSGFLER